MNDNKTLGKVSPGILALTASGMRNYRGLDQRAIVFTIHLKHPSYIESVCNALFEAAESFLTDCLGRAPRISHTGLYAGLDANGSKGSGVLLELNKTHAHGFLCIPHAVSASDRNALVARLIRVAETSEGVRERASVEIRYFERDRSDATVLGWIEYSTKLEWSEKNTRVGSRLGYILPFDDPHRSQREREMMLVRRDIILSELDSHNSFKIFRKRRNLSC